MLLKIDERYCKSLQNQYTALKKTYDEIKNKSPFSLAAKDITKAILLRLKTYYVTCDKIKKLLNKHKTPAASDFFVEAIIFYLQLLFDTRCTNLEVHSEKQIEQKRGSLRPDISIWKNDKVIAAIECKTQLGWNRDKWESDFKKRESRFKRNFPQAKLYLLVMISVNWGGFPKTDKKVGKQYFTLSNEWPGTIKEENINAAIINPIEDLFKQILQTVKYSKRHK